MWSDPMIPRRGILIVLSSPSGAGKTTLTSDLLNWDPLIAFSVSATTRPARPGEREGCEYQFRSRAEFRRMVADGEMLEHAEVFGNLYGTPKAAVEETISKGRDLLFDIDWQGARQLRRSELGRDVVSVFLLPPSIADLRSRLEARAQDSEEVIEGRMEQAENEIDHWTDSEYVLVNRDLDETAANLRMIVMAERLKRVRQPGLVKFVQGLNAEFKGRR